MSDSVGKVSGASTYVGSEVKDNWDWTVLHKVLKSKPKTGVFFKTSERGIGTPIIDMGELFAYDRIDSCIGFELVPVDFEVKPGLRLEFNDLLFARVSMASEAGKVSIYKNLNSDCTHSDKAIRAVVDPTLADPNFLFYFLSSPLGSAIISSISEKTAASSIRRSDLSKLPIPLPPLSLQKEIGGLLDEIDATRSSLLKMNSTLRDILEATYRSWFIDFDPVKAKAKGVQSVAMSTEIAALFPDSFEDSPVGPIPSGWQIIKLSDVSEVIMGQSPPGSSYRPIGEGVPLINGAADYDGSKLSPRKATDSPLRLCQKGSFVFCIRATIGKLVVADAEYCLGRGVASIKEVESTDRWLIFHNIQQSIDKWLNEASGSVIVGIKKDDICDSIIVYPSLEIRTAFHKMVNAMHQLQLKNEQKIIRLAEIRDSLLPRLMSGELNVEALGASR